MLQLRGQAKVWRPRYAPAPPCKPWPGRARFCCRRRRCAAAARACRPRAPPTHPLFPLFPPGIKKQACINRKCLMMVPREDEPTRAPRKRPKQQQRAMPSPTKQHVADTPPALPSPARLPTFTARPRWVDSPGLASRSSTSTPEPFLDDATSVCDSPLVGTFVGIPDPTDGTAEGTFANIDAIDAMSLNDDGVASPRASPQQLAERAATWRSLRDAEPSPARDWCWSNPFLLQEDFYVMNERHRRESSQRHRESSQLIVALA